MKNIVKKIMPILFILFIWCCANLFVEPLFLPKITDVIKLFILLLKNGILIKGFLYSFCRITIATILSMGVSIIIAIIILSNKFIDNLITPIISLIRYLPITAFYPLLMMWFGINELMKISFLFLATFAYFLPTLILIMKNINQDLIDASLLIGVKQKQLTYKIILPYCLPNICKTYLTMYGIGWTYIAIVETANTEYGLGYLINASIQRGRIEQVFVVIVCVVIFSYLFDNICNKIINHFFKWKIKES